MKNRIVICFVLLSVLIAGCSYSADEEDYIKADSAAGIEEMELLLNAEDIGCIQEGKFIDIVGGRGKGVPGVIYVHYTESWDYILCSMDRESKTL